MRSLWSIHHPQCGILSDLGKAQLEMANSWPYLKESIRQPALKDHGAKPFDISSACGFWFIRFVVSQMRKHDGPENSGTARSWSNGGLVIYILWQHSVLEAVVLNLTMIPGEVSSRISRAISCFTTICVISYRDLQTEMSANYHPSHKSKKTIKSSPFLLTLITTPNFWARHPRRLLACHFLPRGFHPRVVTKPRNSIAHSTFGEEGIPTLLRQSFISFWDEPGSDKIR